MDIYRTPALTPRDRAVLDEIHYLETMLAGSLRAGPAWAGGLRRTAQARAVQGSNSIEGYRVPIAEALAAVDRQPSPRAADAAAVAHVRAYRKAMGTVLAWGASGGTSWDGATIRMLHAALLEGFPETSPGQYRTGPIYVHDERADRRVYTGPPAEDVPGLMTALSASLSQSAGSALENSPVSPIVSGAMAHLNLVMIHPFRDGNGRMARLLQTAIIAQHSAVPAELASIEEWLGGHTDEYYRVLGATGRGAWRPDADALPWVRFVIRAHHLQAQAIRQRATDAAARAAFVAGLTDQHRLNARHAAALTLALDGDTVTRPAYIDALRASGIPVDERTATRDLSTLVALGLLVAVGDTRGRRYAGSAGLRDGWGAARPDRQAPADPYPELLATIYALPTSG